MDLDDLAIFQAVVSEGGITRAAARLHRVQSNITTRIRQLEEDLGVDLFVRQGKRLTPSAAGHLLSDYARRLLALAAEARAAVTDHRPRGRLHFGAMESTAAARLAPVLAAFHQRYPDVQIELRTGATGKLAGEVSSGELDCALLCAPINDARLITIPVFSEELVVVAAADHPPISRPADVRNRTLLTFEPRCAYRQRLEQWLATDGVAAERVVELFSYHAMIGCAAAGMGIALVPRSLLACLPNAESVSVHALPAAIAHTTTALIRRADTPAPAVDALLELLLAPRTEAAAEAQTG